MFNFMNKNTKEEQVFPGAVRLLYMGSSCTSDIPRSLPVWQAPSSPTTALSWHDEHRRGARGRNPVSAPRSES